MTSVEGKSKRSTPSSSSSRDNSDTPVRMTRSRTSASLSPSPSEQPHQFQSIHQQQQGQVLIEEQDESNDDNSVQDQEEQEIEIQDQDADDDEATTPSTSTSTNPSPSRSHLRKLKIRRKLISILINLFSLLPYLLIPASLILPLALTWPQSPISRNIYVDENALQPAQANLYFDSFQVQWTHSIFDHLSRLDSHQERLHYVQEEFKRYGLDPFRQDYHFLEDDKTTTTTITSPDSDSDSGSGFSNKGTNVYARWNAPRTNGREAIILNASWKSRWTGGLTDEYDTLDIKQRREGMRKGERNDSSSTFSIEGIIQGDGINRLNQGGVAMLLSLAKFLSTQSHLSKDVILVISDGHLEGMHAWSNSYFGREQSNLHSTPLTLSSGSSLIHSSISIDSPLLTFSSFQPLLTGMNGLKPNLDIYNTFQRILSRVGSNVDSGKPGYGTTIPIRFDLNEERKYGITYNVEDTQRQREEREERERLGERRIWEWNLLSNPGINRLIGKGEEEREFRFGEWLESYFRLGQRGMEKLRRSNGNFWRDGFKMVRGTTDGPSGVLNQFHVDSFTVYATPDVAGPYRTKELGRVLESQIRSMSNLLERLHHSQFFYFLATPNTFIQIGLALPCALLLSAALTIQGLKRWSKEGKFSSMRRSEIFKRTRIEVEALQQSTFKSSIRSPRDLSLENPSVDQLVDCLLDEISNESLQSDQSHFFKIKQTCQKFKRQVDQTNRPVGQALAIMTACCIFGLAISMLLKRENCDSLVAEIPQLKKLNTSIVVLITSSGIISSFGVSLLPSSDPSSRRSLASTLHSFNLLYSGIVILSISLLNLPLAYALGITAGLPLLFFGPNLSISSPRSSSMRSLLEYLRIPLSIASLPPIFFYLLVLDTHPALKPLGLERFNLLLHFLPPTPPESQASGFFQFQKKDIYELYCRAVRESNYLGGVTIDVVGAVWIPMTLILLVSNLI